MIHRAVVLVALAAACLAPVCSSAADAPAAAAGGAPVPVAVVGAPVPAEASGAGSLLRPAVLRATFRVPRADTALYVGTSWFVRDLTVTVIGPGARRATLVAMPDLPGRMLGLRLPADAWRADRVELHATSVSTAAAPYLLPAEQLASIAWRSAQYAAFFGLFLALALLHAVLALLLRSRACGWLAAALAALAALQIPYLGVVRPPPEISQPLHAALQSLVFAALALFALAYAGSARLRRIVPIALWVLVVGNAIAVGGGDVLQDIWLLPDAAAQVLVVAFDAALVVIGVVALRRTVPGAPFFVAGTALATLAALAPNVPLPLDAALPSSVPLAGIAGEALLLTLALRARLLRGDRTPAQRTNADGLTEIANRTALDERLAADWNRARRVRAPLAALLLDVDHFKSYNDTYGHLAGDDVLRRIAAALAQTASRAHDLAGRYGGDKFLLLLPDTDLAGAERIAASVRTTVAALELAHGGVPSKRLTVSIGVASLVPPDEPAHTNDAGTLVQRADVALHIAKSMGRNRTVTDEPLAAQTP